MARPKGSKNRATLDRIDKAMEGGISPLEYMLSVLRDPKASQDRRDAAAKAAAPYLHPRLQYTELDASGDLVIKLVAAPWTNGAGTDKDSDPRTQHLG